MDLAFNNLQRLICHKTQQTKPWQHNTSFLLTSKDELKYPGGSLPKQPKPFTLSFTLFQYLTRLLYLFIYLVNYISPSRTIQKWVHKFFGTYEIRQDFAHILPKLPSPVSKYPLQHNGLASYLTPKILNPIPGGPSQPSVATKQYLK